MPVVNVKVANIRKQGYNCLEDWMENDNNVYIGRAGVVFVNGIRFPKVSSEFSNPYKIGKDGDREQVIQKYKDYIIEKINKSPELKDKLISLDGKNLGCWCHPEKCHGDILLEIIDIYKKN